MVKKAENHEKAPVCAAFVKEMREVFGEVQVLYVKEGKFELGEPDKTEYGHFVPQNSVKKNHSPSGRVETRQEEEE